MTIKTRTEAEQQRLNSQMCRKDVLKWALFQSIHAKPASQAQARRFLTSAPPEVLVLLRGLVPRPSQASIHDEALHENRIVQGFVGLAIERRDRGR